MSTRDSETSTWVRRGRRGEAERLALAESARFDADTARRQADLDRLNAEAARKRADAMRVVAQTTAMKMATERDEAIAKASELEDELAAAHDQLAGQPAAEPEANHEDVAAAEPVATPPQETSPAPRQPAPDPAAPESVRFAPRGHRPVLTVVMALASLCAAAAAVYLAYRDQLTSGPGLLAAAATVVLAVAVGRTGRNVTTVTIERGIVHVTAGGTSERADLTSPTTLVELIGGPGERDRKVMLVRKTRGPLSIDESMVDLDTFIEAARRWRPDL